MVAAVSQVNARIDAELKEAGDAALAKAGLTPTKAIRGLWARFARLADCPEEIRELVSGRGDELPSEARAERDRKLALVREGSQIVAQSLASRGVDAPEVIEEIPYEELRELVLLERLSERGQDA